MDFTAFAYDRRSAIPSTVRTSPRSHASQAPQLPTTELPSFNPLAEKFQNAKVEFRLSNASLKKIVDYVLAIENAPHMLKVTSLKIKALYQNKLYFDATLEVEGIVSKK